MHIVASRRDVRTFYNKMRNLLALLYYKFTSTQTMPFPNHESKTLPKLSDKKRIKNGRDTAALSRNLTRQRIRQ